MIKKMIGVFIGIILIVSLFSMIINDGDYDTEEERWTEVKYSTKIFADYPEYYPIEISFRSQGSLPKDLQEHHNYTGTVFISKYVISFNSSEIGDANKEIEKENEYIGREWKTITFDNFKDLGNNISAIRVNITLFPHNSSLDISEDNYSFDIILSHEVEIENVGGGTSLIFLPLIIAPILILWQKYLNKIFLDNVNTRNMFMYTLKYPKNRVNARITQWKRRRQQKKKAKKVRKQILTERFFRKTRRKGGEENSQG